MSTVASVWIPLAAELTPANAADNDLAPRLLAHLPAEVRFVLGDLHYTAPNVREVCQRDERILITPRYGPYPHTDDGVEVRRVFHKLRSANLEIFNELFKGIFDVHGSGPTKACGLRVASPSASSSSTSSLCWPAHKAASIPASGSRPSSRRPDL